MGRWMKPEVYPLLGALGFVASIGVFSLVRHLFMNPEVRIEMEKRGMGVLDNTKEGERYAEHGLRKFLRTQPPEIVPSINKFFRNDKKKPGTDESKDQNN